MNRCDDRVNVLMTSLLVVFFIIDIALCFLLVKASASNEHECAARIEERHLFEENSSYCANVLSGDISEFLELAGIPVLERDVVYFLIPPFPCDGCFRQQCEALDSFLEMNPSSQFEIEVVCPSFYARDMNARFELLSVIGYDYDYSSGETGNAVADYSSCLILSFAGGHLEDYYLTNTLFPDFTRDYLDRIFQNR